MPGDKAPVVRLLDEKARAPDQNVGTNDALDGVEDAGMAHDLIDPGQQQMAFRAQRSGGQPARGLDLLELAAIAASLLRRQGANGREISFPLIPKGCLLRQSHRGLVMTIPYRRERSRPTPQGAAAAFLALPIFLRLTPYRATWCPCARRRRCRSNPWDCDL